MNESTKPYDQGTTETPFPDGQDPSADQDPNLKPNPNANDGAPADAAAPPEELVQAQKQRDDYFDQLQRTRAEFVNFQKRSKTQAETDRLHAVGGLARDLFDALDNLERATEALRGSAGPGITDGLDMVHRQLLASLAKHGVEPIQAQGRPFDPNLHDAVVQQPDAGRPEGTVVAELSKGYKLHDRVLRPTKVAVSVKPAQP